MLRMGAALLLAALAACPFEAIAHVDSTSVDVKSSQEPTADAGHEAAAAHGTEREEVGEDHHTGASHELVDDAEHHEEERHEEFHHAGEAHELFDDAEDHGQEGHEESHHTGESHEHFDGAGDHGHEEHEASPVDVAISCCLCGGVSLIMMLFYLVNYQDRDIRFYAWSIISSTISIFLSVLLYQGLNSFITHYFIQFTATGTWGLIGVAYTLMIGWMIVCQVVMMFIADILKLPECMVGNRHSMMQSWGRLCAHIAGFASIRAGCALHHLHGLASDPLTACILVLAHSAVLAGLGWLFGSARASVARRRGITSTRWLEEICDAENDVSALSLSFLTVQVLRFAISGVLPNHEGLEEPQLEHPLACSLELFAAAGGFAVLVVVTVMVLSRGRIPEGAPRRILNVMQVTAAMACAWCMFFASKWELRRCIYSWDPNAMSARVVLALAVSAGAFMLIFVLDKLEDLDATGRDTDRAIVSLISAMGILVGFSWEQSFEGAVVVFSSLTPVPHLVELGIACLTAIIVLPAWRNYILTSLVKSEAHYLRNDAKQRTRELAPEAMELVMESLASAGNVEWAPEVGRACSRSMMLISAEAGERSPKN